MEEAHKGWLMIRIGEWVNVSSVTGSPGLSRMKGHKMVVVVVVVCVVVDDNVWIPECVFLERAASKRLYSLLNY